MSTDLTAIEFTRIIAIVRLKDYNQALEVARALMAGGISVIEFTLTGRGAIEAIARTRAELGSNVLVGAGTVLTRNQVAEVATAGAQFVVTPVLSLPVIEASHAHNVPVICGALTPSEIQTAHEAGAEMVKVFPARQVGPHYLRDILAPLPHLRLVPTGGIDAHNAADYLKAGAVAVGIGGSLVAEQAVAAGDWGRITQQARLCVNAVQI